MKQEVYFKNIQSKIVELLERAEFDIKIAVAWFTDEKIIRLLNEKQKNGINITVVIYDDHINSIDAFNYLNKLGGKVYLSKNLMHNKFCIIDEEIVINGSYNWTINAKSNHENITVTYNNSEFCSEFLNEFNSLIKGKKKLDSTLYINDFENSFFEYYERVKNDYSLPFIYINKSYSSLEYYYVDTDYKKESVYFIIEINKIGLDKFKRNFALNDEYYKRYKSLKEFSFKDSSLRERDLLIEEQFATFKNETNLIVFKNYENENGKKSIYEKSGTIYMFRKNICEFKSLNYEGYCHITDLKIKITNFKDTNETYLIYDENLNLILESISNKEGWYTEKLFDINGKIKNELNIFGQIRKFTDNFIVHKKNGKYGLINRDEEVIIDYIFQGYIIKNNDVLILFQEPVVTYNYYNESIDVRSIYNKNSTNEIDDLKIIQSKKLAHKLFHFDTKGKLTKEETFWESSIGFNYYLYDIKKQGLYEKLLKSQSLLRYSTNEINGLKDVWNLKDIDFFREFLDKILTIEQKEIIKNYKKEKYNQEFKGSSCYIATLAYGDINHPKVELFRNFRDKYLINFFLGRLFIKKYYKYSPNLVVFLKPYKSVNKFIRFGLDLLLKLIPTNKND